MKKIIIISLMFFSFMFFVEVAGAKVLPQASKAGIKVAPAKSSGSGIKVTPRLRADKKALIVYFSNLQNAKSVSYALSYDTSTQSEGAMGAIHLTGTSKTSQEILFGTCSNKVCRYHSGISNMKLEVSYTTKEGRKYIKRYKIRI